LLKFLVLTASMLAIQKATFKVHNPGQHCKARTHR
jgi:hypothetical protein